MIKRRKDKKALNIFELNHIRLKKAKVRPVYISHYVILLIIMLLAFVGIGRFIILGINQHYQDHVRQLSVNLAEGYISSITRSRQAEQAIDSLLDDKLLIASEATAIYTRIESNEDVKQAAETLRVDEINIYDAQANLLFTTIEALQNWQAYPGHPVHDFARTDEIRMTEQVRANVVTGIYYKYGYYKLPNGNIVQIGVSADQIRQFMHDFEMHRLLQEIIQNEQLLHACLIDENMIVIESTHPEAVGRMVADASARQAIRENREHIEISQLMDDTLDLYLPILIDGEKVGTLLLGHSLADNMILRRQFSLFGISLLFFLFMIATILISKSYAKNSRLIQLAYFDALTQLPNNLFLQAYLASDLQQRSRVQGALMIINASNFKTINMTYGYNYGDMILCHIADQLKKLVDQHVFVSRLTGDRFIIYHRQYQDRAQLTKLADEIVAIYRQPFEFEGIKKYLQIEMGILEVKSDHENADHILKNLSIALTYAARDQAKGYAFFDSEMEARIRRENDIEAALREILEAAESGREPKYDQFFMVFQPQYHLAEKRVTGFEALARLNARVQGFVPPPEFIAVAEQKQLIQPLGYLILDLALNFLQMLKQQGYTDMFIAINLSAYQLQSDDFTSYLLNLVETKGLKPAQIELELTESALADDFDSVNQRLKILHAAGFMIAIDDFGTGYSSFFRLGEMHVNKLKLDRYFTSQITQRTPDKQVIEEIITMSHKLDLKVVAEGVELAAEQTFLEACHCDMIQGYLLSRPLPMSDALDYLKNND